MDFKEKIRVIEGFPKEGISFKDITTLIKDGDAFVEMINIFRDKVKELNIDAIAGPEARGFIFGVPIAYALGIGFIPIRKKGKLPAKTTSLTYKLEYGEDTLEIHEDAITKGMRVALIDDLLATGGTIVACKDLLEKAGAEVPYIGFAIELTELNGRDKLKGYNVESLVQYEL